MNNVSTIAPTLRAVEVPLPLRSLPAWLLWRFEHFVGEAKPRKIPYWANGTRRHGQQGSAFDREHLTTFEVALEAAVRGGYDGVGFAPLADFGYVFLDFDNCIEPDGAFSADIHKMVDRTYAERSPSGKGIRAVLKGNLGNHKSGTSGGYFGFETFSSSGFVTFTGYILPNCEILGYHDKIADVDDFTRSYCETRFGSTSQIAFDPDDFMLGREPKLSLTVSEMDALLSNLDPSMGREPWLRVAMALHHETDGDDTGFELWDEWSSKGDSYPGTDGLRYQWDSLRPAVGKRAVTMRSVIKMAKDAGYRIPEAVTTQRVLQNAEKIQAQLSPETRNRFTPLPAFELTQLPPLEWLIKGLLPKGELGIIFGASGSGKTFLILDLLFAVARGVDWRGRKVKQGRVVIVAAEGGNGIGMRIEAYARYYNIDMRTVDMHIITAAPNYMDGDDVSELIAEIKQLGNVMIIATDTLAQVSPGANENTSEDMGRVLRNVKLIHEATDAMNLLVHHAGKDLSKGSRGWSGLKGAADVQLEVVRHENGSRELVLEKLKDGVDGTRWSFKLESVDVGMDFDGDIITSCVAVEADAPAREEPNDRLGIKRRGRVENHVLEVMTIFGDQSIVSAVDLIDRAVAMLPAPEIGKRDTRRQVVTRAIQMLSKEKDGPLRMDGGKIIFYE